MKTNISVFFILCAAVLFLAANGLNAGAAVSAADVYQYETKQKNGEIGKARMIIGPKQQADRRLITWEVESKTNTRTERFVYDGDLNIRSWSVTDAEEGSDYQARLDKNYLTFKGRLEGKNIARTIDVSGLPLYANPKIGLSKMGTSKTQDFWAIRNDTLSTVKMTALYKGIDLILVNGELVRAYRIYWKPKRLPEMFFNRTYWFRESDGLYLKQEGSNGCSRILIKEN